MPRPSGNTYGTWCGCFSGRARRGLSSQAHQALFVHGSNRVGAAGPRHALIGKTRRKHFRSTSRETRSAAQSPWPLLIPTASLLAGILRLPTCARNARGSTGLATCRHASLRRRRSRVRRLRSFSVGGLVLPGRSLRGTERGSEVWARALGSRDAGLDSQSKQACDAGCADMISGRCVDMVQGI